MSILKKIISFFLTVRKNSEAALQINIHKEIRDLSNQNKYQDPKNLVKFGYKVYSQSDEDGILLEIFRRIGTSNKIFVEFGVGNGLENNTLFLLFQGWTGLWIDGSSKDVSSIKKHLSKFIERGHLKLVNKFIYKENINEIIDSQDISGEIDLLSIDIDGNDHHIFNEINQINPRVVVMEYNAKFPPPLACGMEYSARHIYSSNDCFGSSLAYQVDLMAIKGFHLVGCNLSGINAFYVRKDLAKDLFVEPFSAENHYEPARYHLSAYKSGHPSSFKTINNFQIKND